MSTLAKDSLTLNDPAAVSAIEGCVRDNVDRIAMTDGLAYTFYFDLFSNCEKDDDILAYGLIETLGWQYDRRLSRLNHDELNDLSEWIYNGSGIPRDSVIIHNGKYCIVEKTFRAALDRVVDVSVSVWGVDRTRNMIVEWACDRIVYDGWTLTENAYNYADQEEQR